MSRKCRQTAFTLIEFILVLLLLGSLSASAMARFQDLSLAAESAKIDSIFTVVSNYLHNANGFQYTLLGSPDNFTDVDLNGLSVNYRNKLIRRTATKAHVPLGTPNRNSQATRFWYMIFSVPPTVIARNDSSGHGWAMYNGAATCGVNRSRCWKYRKAGLELAVITYEFITGSVTLVKNI